MPHHTTGYETIFQYKRWIGADRTYDGNRMGYGAEEIIEMEEGEKRRLYRSDKII